MAADTAQEIPTPTVARLRKVVTDLEAELGDCRGELIAALSTAVRLQKRLEICQRRLAKIRGTR